MRDLSGGLEFLSLNWATVREQWNLRQAIEGCARHGIPGIAPWREPLQAMGRGAAARLIRERGLAVSGLCRAGMFAAADAAGLLRDPELAAARMRNVMATHGVEA